MPKNTFIPIWEYAKRKGLDTQKVYRWIRERKIKEEDIKVVEKVVERKLINKDAVPNK